MTKIARGIFTNQITKPFATNEKAFSNHFTIISEIKEFHQMVERQGLFPNVKKVAYGFYMFIAIYSSWIEIDHIFKAFKLYISERLNDMQIFYCKRSTWYQGEYLGLWKSFTTWQHVHREAILRVPYHFIDFKWND